MPAVYLAPRSSQLSRTFARGRRSTPRNQLAAASVTARITASLAPACFSATSAFAEESNFVLDDLILARITDSGILARTSSRMSVL